MKKKFIFSEQFKVTRTSVGKFNLLVVKVHRKLHFILMIFNRNVTSDLKIFNTVRTVPEEAPCPQLLPGNKRYFKYI